MQAIKSGQVQDVLDSINLANQTPMVFITLGPGESDENLLVYSVDEVDYSLLITLLTMAIQEVVFTHEEKKP
jgi:hypothetical protein